MSTKFFYALRWRDSSQPVLFRPNQALEFAERYGFDSMALNGPDTDIELLDDDGVVVGWVVPA